MKPTCTRTAKEAAVPPGACGRPAGLASRLIERAARRTPPSLSARLEEEWLAELAARSALASRLRFAVGCCWASRSIVRSDWAGRAAAVSAAGGQRALAAYFPRDPIALSRRALIVFSIAALHVVLIYALETSLVSRIARAIPQTIEATVTEVARAHPEALPPPSPKLTTPRVSVPQPVVDLSLPPDPTAIETFVPRQQAAPVPPPPPRSIQHPDIRVLGGPGPGFPNSDEYYPSIERRLGESGVVTVSVCVGPDGKLTAKPAIVRPSGYDRIDLGALELARAGSGRYRPTTDNGEPVNSCFAYRIRFTLRE